MTLELPPPGTRPTLYFIGVTTKSSSIRTVFPRWAEHLGLDAVLEGIDLPPHAPAADYRRVVEFLAADELGRGALVTTHKLDLFTACRDLFARVDPLAELMHEVSCLSKADGVVAHAKDPISSGLAVDAIVPSGYWKSSDAEVFLMGAGGAAIAISWYLGQSSRGADRPRRIVVSDRDPARLAALERIHTGTDIPIETVATAAPGDNDRVLAGLAPGSFVVNATGLGKDAPGSPLTDGAVFPRDAIAWDLNYRGELKFLDQARAAGHVRVHDGWVYFLHGWTQVIAEVFGIGIATEGPEFQALSDLASGARR